ncbi:MAG: polysulfide reductase [Actinomycetia bacterium]|nr:polysulfide reductase [Actinomycetes bacterium]
MTDTSPAGQVRTYYGQPVLKRPTWTFYIPSYFYLGGLAAGSSLLAAGADATGDQPLARAARVTALGALGVGMPALVADLGRPARFHHMLRVVRPTSPMNVGSWLLSAYGPMVGIAALSDVTGRARVLGAVATWGAAALAPGVATYTGVLLADTAIPAWHDARRMIPALFAAGAAASSGGIATVILPDAKPARSFAIGGALTEAAIASTHHRRLPEEVARAYNTGRPATLQRFASAASLAGAFLVASAGRSRVRARLGGAVIAAGALAERFAVTEAGHASAADPVATIGPQRATRAQIAPAGACL